MGKDNKSVNSKEEAKDEKLEATNGNFYNELGQVAGGGRVAVHFTVCSLVPDSGSGHTVLEMKDNLKNNGMQ